MPFVASYGAMYDMPGKDGTNALGEFLRARRERTQPVGSRVD